MSDLLQKIKDRESNWFDNTILVLILVTGLFLAAETTPNIAHNLAHIIYIFNYVIVIAFVIEFFIKLYAYSFSINQFFANKWNGFDFIIISSNIVLLLASVFLGDKFEIIHDIHSYGRISIILRLFTFFYQLRRLIITLIKSLPSMGSVGLILLLLFFVYGLIGYYSFKGSDPANFGSLFVSILTLFQTVTGEGWPELLAIQKAQGNTYWAALYYVSFVALGAMVILNLFIAIIISELQNIRELEAIGREEVVVKNHIVILGWTKNIKVIFEELIESLDKRGSIDVAVLAEASKQTMQDHYYQNVPKNKQLNVHFRTGNPYYEYDLNIVNINNAKAIIILSDAISHSDSFKSQMLLTLNQRFTQLKRLPNITFILKYEWLEHLNEVILDNKFYPVIYKNLISKIIIRNAKHPGIFEVYNELFSFVGSEIYTAQFNKIDGITFGEMTNYFSKSTVIGIIGSNGKVILNPPTERIVYYNETVVAIAKDASDFYISNTKTKKANLVDVRLRNYNSKDAEKILIIGWNEMAELIIKDMVEYLHRDSTIDVLVDPDLLPELPTITSCSRSSNIRIKHYKHRDYRKLADLFLDDYQSILFLNYYSYKDSVDADTDVVINYTYLKDIMTKRNIDVDVIAEIINEDNSTGSLVSKDFVQVNRILYSQLTQYAIDPKVKVVFDNLFETGGAEIVIMPVEDFLDYDYKYNTKQLYQSFLETDLIFIGYYKNGKNILTSTMSEVSFRPGDKLIFIL